MITSKVPYLPTLDSLDLTSVSLPMDDQAARNFINTINWKEKYPYCPVAVVDIARGEKEIYLYFIVREKCIWVANSKAKDGDDIRQDTCVSFHCKTEKQTSKFDFNCLGVCNTTKHSLGKEGLSTEEYATIRRYASIRKNFQSLSATSLVDWELAVSIPFELMGIDPNELPDRITGNFYKWGRTFENSYYLSWNPVQQDEPQFDCPDSFGELIFEKAHTK